LPALRPRPQAGAKRFRSQSGGRRFLVGRAAERPYVCLLNRESYGVSEVVLPALEAEARWEHRLGEEGCARQGRRRGWCCCTGAWRAGRRRTAAVRTCWSWYVIAGAAERVGRWLEEARRVVERRFGRAVLSL